MSSAPAPTSPPVAGPAWTPRTAHRELEDGWLGGVAAGIAAHTGLPLLAVRAAFVATTALGGLGVALYACWWVLLPVAPTPEEAPGLESARRGDRRPRSVARLADAGPALALVSLGVGTLLVLQGLVGRATVFWPLALGTVGVALVWRQADEAQRERWSSTTTRMRPGRLILGSGGPRAAARVVAGLALVAAALLILAVSSGFGAASAPALLILAVSSGFGAASAPALAVLLTIAGVVVVIGPWLYRLATDLGAEREQRVRTQERADVAAHLHDSVLQTLALIQRNAADAGTVVRLARSQERELRSWLYAGEVADDTTLARALRQAAAEVEDAHGVEVVVVTVGDLDLSEPLRPLVAATREAVTNAVKHAGVARVDVYAETGATAIEVFVRDRGRGFDPAAVPSDRLGLRSSIVERMERHGGTAEVRTAPDEGTEVRLRLPRTDGSEEER